MRAYANAEWDRLKSVALHRPSFETFFGVLDPKSSLYERTFDRKAAEAEHYKFAEALSMFGIRVYMLEESIEKASRKDSFRKELEALAYSSIRYAGRNTESRKLVYEQMESYSPSDLLMISELKPEIRKAGARSEFVVREPLSNLYFMRDQQVTTPGGIIIGRMSKPQRAPETRITSLFFKSLGISHMIPEYKNGTLEGGDYMPCGEFALIGIGDRTNEAGAKKLMDSLKGFDEVALVEQPRHPLMVNGFDPMLDMHLDTYFNILADGLAVGQPELLKLAGVKVFLKSGNGFEKIPESTNLYDYITSKGFAIIGLSMLEQASFGSNFLCLGKDRIVSVDCKPVAEKVVRAFSHIARSDAKYARISARLKSEYSKGMYNFPNRETEKRFGIDYLPIDLSNLTGGYGGAHCMSCVIERR